MVRLSKIYTKTGDAGQTMLGDGKFVPKADLRVEAYGSVDEANAELGVAVVTLRDSTKHPDVLSELERLQHDLFDVGADLCVPIEAEEKPGEKLRVTEGQVERLERLIDRFNEPLKPLNSFVLPGGSASASRLHVARTAVRRAERRVAELCASEPARTNPQTMVYLNRLSDLLFVWSRSVNAAETGAGDVLWKPGANRGG